MATSIFNTCMYHCCNVYTIVVSALRSTAAMCIVHPKRARTRTRAVALAANRDGCQKQNRTLQSHGSTAYLVLRSTDGQPRVSPAVTMLSLLRLPVATTPLTVLRTAIQDMYEFMSATDTCAGSISSTCVHVPGLQTPIGVNIPVITFSASWNTEGTLRNTNNSET